jgi:hypothetical protein
MGSVADAPVFWLAVLQRSDRIMNARLDVTGARRLAAYLGASMCRRS